MRRRPAPVFAAVSIVVCALLSWTSRADAYERQWHAGVGAGYALVNVYDSTAHGFGGGLHLTYGLTDAFNAMLEADVTLHPSSDLVIAGAAVGPAYVLDVLQWVPYLGLLVGGYDVWSHSDLCGTPDQPPCHAAHLGIGVPIGLDYQITRSFAVGAQVRYTLMLFGESSPINYLTAFARAE